MKKNLFAALCLLLVASSLSAMDILVGPKVSLGDTSYHGADWQQAKGIGGLEEKLSLSFTGGGFVRFQFAPMFGLQVEALYSHRTTRNSDPGSGDDYWYQYSYDSINFPVYARLQYDFDRIGIYALTGLEFCFLFDKYKYKNSNDTENEYYFSEHDGNRSQIGLGFGAGLTVPGGPGVFDIGVRYSTSFTQIWEGRTTFFESLDLDFSYAFKI